MRAALALALAAVAAQSCAAVTPQASISPAPASTAVAVATVEPTPTVDLATTQPTPLPTATPFTVCPSPPKIVGDVSLSPICVPGANVLVENAFAYADLRVLYDQVALDLTAVQQEFAWTLRRRPTVDVFAAPKHEYTRALFEAAPGRNAQFGVAAGAA